MSAPTLVWFRHDLRLAANPALHDAARAGPLIAVYVLDDTLPWAPGGAARWWLHHSLSALGADLAAHGVPLILRRGAAAAIIPDLAQRLGVARVVWNRLYSPAAIARDSAIKATLTAAGIAAQSHPGGLLAEPWTVQTQQGGWFKVFTPFWKTLRARTMADPPPLPALHPGVAPLAGDRLDDWGLLPTAPDWAGGLRASWTPGARGAQARLDEFLDRALPVYADGRDIPGAAHTSRLSPHLAFGEIAPVQIWHAIQARLAARPALAKHGEKFLAELGWREFSHHLLYHVPTLPETSWRGQYEAFPWRDDARDLRAWQRGMTGYPIVDAGMRELWATGWMHNRVRMIVASFLVKDLFIHWRAGADWFWDTLVDADLANNAASWQWVAGCGADAAPYFRIFNPVLQGEKFDPAGTYVRRWVPELAALPDRVIHQPWRAAGKVSYPPRIVDHDAARSRALAAFAELKSA